MRSARKGVKTEREVHEEHPGSFMVRTQESEEEPAKDTEKNWPMRTTR